MCIATEFGKFENSCPVFPKFTVYINEGIRKRYLEMIPMGSGAALHTTA